MSSTERSKPTGPEPRRNIGNAPSTNNGDHSSMNHFNRHLQESEQVDSLADLTQEHVEGDNLERVLALFLEYFGETNVRADKGAGFLAASAKKTYASKVKEALQHKFPRHEYWNDHDVWKKLLAKFCTSAARTEQQGGSTGERKCFPIYKDISELPFGTIRLKDFGVLIYDLKSILLALLKGGKKLAEKLYQKRFELMLCYNADGRGGEHFLLKWCDGNWDARFNMPDFTWRIPKQLDEQPMMFAPEMFTETSWVVDIYHAAGCYFVVDGGALNYLHPKAAQPFVFPSLHKYERSYIAQRVTDTLRKGVQAIAKGTASKQVLSKVSSRSLRKGANTTLAVHEGVTPDQRIGMGAWSHHHNGEVYVEGSPALVAPGALAFAGRKNVNCGAEVHPPSFGWLGDCAVQQVNNFLGKLCRVDIPELMPNGQLRQFWLASMAALVMNHPNMVRDLGRKNVVCQKVVQAAKEANITDARFPSGTSPECVLLEWSKIMQTKSVELNLDRPLPDEDVTAHLKFMTERLDENTHKTASTGEQVQELRGELQSLHGDYLRMSSALENATSALVTLCEVFKEDLDATSPQKRKRLREAVGLVTAKRPAMTGSAGSAGSDSVAAAPLEELEEQGGAARFGQLDQGELPFEQPDPEAASTAKRSLKDIVFEEYKAGKFLRTENPMCLSDVACPPDIKREAAKFARSMKALCLGFDKADWLVVSGVNSDQKAQDKAEVVIQASAKKALEAMLRMEVDAGIGEDKKKPGSHATATATALGERYRLWEQKVGTHADQLYEKKLAECGYKSKVQQSRLVAFFQKRPPVHATPPTR
jgi:hypothetical protein